MRWFERRAFPGRGQQLVGWHSGQQLVGWHSFVLDPQAGIDIEASPAETARRQAAGVRRALAHRFADQVLLH